MSKSSKADAIYLRVSSKQQDTKSQEPDLQRWIESRSGNVVWYRDTFTGKTMDRPGWNKLEADIRAGKISSVVVWRLDRLGRTVSGLSRLFEELRERKVNLISLKDGIDLGTSAGRLMANVLASVAQYETEIRGERVLAGQASAKAKGKRWGGSVKGKRKKVKASHVKAILHLRKEGQPIAAIARTMHLSRPTVYDVLSEAGA